jgi:hypothetical protein
MCSEPDNGEKLTRHQVQERDSSDFSQADILTDILFEFLRHVRNTGYLCTMTSMYTLNLLKPTGHVMHQQFNIQQLYVLPTLYLCVLYLSENKQRLVPLTS